MKIICDAAFSSKGAVVACIIGDSFGRLIDFFGKKIIAPAAVFTEAIEVREDCVMS